MKTEADIRDDLYRYISSSELKTALSGNIYKYDGERPDKSSKEDLVIAPLSDIPADELQEVIVNIRIYVADLYDNAGSLYRAHGIRLREIQDICKKVFDTFRTDEARCVLETMKTFKVEGRDEHCIVNRINYKHCNY